MSGESFDTWSKKWRVYAPLDIELPEESSPDLPHEVIGKPILEVTLNVGDVLYLPRGTIHEAEAQEETSSHLTLSTYQKWNWHELAERVIEISAASPAMPRSLREGLPSGFIYSVGVEHALRDANAKPGQAAASLPSAANRLASCLRDMAMAVEDNCDVVEDAVDEMAAEFVKARLPPYPSALAPKGDIPTLDSAICCRAPGMCRLIEADSDSESDDEDGDEDDFMGAHGACEDPGCGHEHHHAEGGGAPAAGKKGEKDSEEAAAEAGDLDGGDDDDDEDEDDDSESDMEPSFRYRLITSLHNQRETHMIDMGSDGEDDDGGMGAHMGVKLGENESDSDEDDEAPPSLVPISAAAAAAAAKAAKGKAIAKKGQAVAEEVEAAEADDNDADLIGDVDLEEDLVGSGLAIPEGHAHAVATILGCIGGKSVRVRDLVLLGDEGDDASQTKLLMVQALHSLGVVRVLDTAAADALAAASKKRKGDGSAPSGKKHKKKGGHKTMIKN